MSAPPYMKLYWGDYHKDTRHLSRSEHGAYLLLLGETWRLGGALPNDDSALARWALCTPSEWAEIRPVILAFFTLSRGRWVHKRVRAELAHYADVSRKRKVSGKAGGEATGGKRKRNTPAIAEQKPTKPEPESEPEREDKSSLSAAREHAASPSLSEDLIAEAQARIAEAVVELDAAEHAKRFLAHAEATGRKLVRPDAAWREWIRREIDKAPKAQAPLAAAPRPVWTGPAPLRAALVAVMGEDWVRAWIDARTRYQDLPKPHALIAANGFVFDRIWREERVREVLSDHGVELRKAEDAA